MPLAFGRDEPHPLVDTLLRGRAVSRAIDARDDMLDHALRYLHDGDRDRALAGYFLSGLEQLDLVRHVAPPAPPRSVLELACGYGRLTRFLDRSTLLVSDLDPGALEFQRGELGTRTLPSSTRPDAFDAPGEHDLIVVFSLFTHLHPDRLAAWLRRLVALLSPRGRFAFSTHDGPPGFTPTSESRVLDPGEYGSSCVTEAFVRAQLDPALACVRLPREVDDFQDLFVVSRAPLDGLAPRPRARVTLGLCEASLAGARIQGTGGPVQIFLDGEPVAAAGDGPWTVDFPVRSLRYQVLSVVAGPRVVYLGSVDSLRGDLARTRLDPAERALADLSRSRLWRVRNAIRRVVPVR